MPGPARKPTATKQLEGTDRKDRTNPNEPKPLLIGSKEPPPAWLVGRSARKGWREIVPLLAGMRVGTIADRLAIGLLCDAFGRWLDAAAAIRELGGTTYETETEAGSKMRREHPEVGQEERAWEQCRKLLVEFGLTAASRSRVSATRPGGSKPAKGDLSAFEQWQQRTGGAGVVS